MRGKPPNRKKKMPAKSRSKTVRFEDGSKGPAYAKKTPRWQKQAWPKSPRSRQELMDAPQKRKQIKKTKANRSRSAK